MIECKFPKEIFGKLIEPILKSDAVQTKKYFIGTLRNTNHPLVVKATRRLFNKKIDKRSRIVEIMLTVGEPNFAEREFIKQCKKTGEAFPKKIQIKYINKD